MTRLIAGLVALAAACSAAQVAAASPTDIAVPDGHKAYLTAHAVGVQIYSCSGSAWTLVAPRADLYDSRGKLVATHFAGPTWQAKDGSSVVGKREASVNVDPTAIDWLRLAAASTASDPEGGDRLAGTTYIQRINTVGGRAPGAPCAAGATAEVPYTADYVFWKRTG